MRYTGVISRGVRLPIIKAGEEQLQQVIINGIEGASNELNTPVKNKDIICITESIVARSENNYVTVDNIADDITKKFGDNQEIILIYPIYSRNRFSMILKGIARAASKLHIFINDGKDEVGNDLINPFTNVDIKEFYKNVVESENCQCEFHTNENDIYILWETKNCFNEILCKCHCTQNDIDRWTYKGTHVYTLADICSEPSDCHGYNEEYGVLGSNKATEESLKLFPRYQTCQKLCLTIQEYFVKEQGVEPEIMVYGDGCFKDPVGEIWEFADPVVSPYYTHGLEGTPNEVKIKYIADNESNDNDYVKNVIKTKDSNLKGKMISQGTTPRRYVDLIGSLADLTSGSGDKGTPVVWISGYFDNYTNE